MLDRAEPGGVSNPLEVIRAMLYAALSEDENPVDNSREEWEF
jgi:hypothetical protein